MALDGTTASGSMHIVDLPDVEAARVFAFDEPNFKAGVYGEVLVRRWSNLLGRTMKEFTSRIVRYRRFLIIGHGGSRVATDHTDQNDLQAEHRGYALAGRYRDRLIACGPLLSDDGRDWIGTAAVAELPDRAAAQAMLAHEA